MGSPRRFTDGVTNVSSSNPLGNLPYLDPTKWIVYHEDFCAGFLGANSVNNTTKTAFGVSCIASANGTVSVATDATDAPLGCLKIVTTAADNEYGWLQSLSPGFAMKSGKKAIFETRFEITHTAGNIEQNELFIGLASYSASVTAAFATNGTAMAADDAIGFYSPDADTNINFVIRENDVADSQIIKSTYATATWYIMTAYYDGTNAYLYVDNVEAGILNPDQIPVSVIGPSVFFKSGEAKVHQLLVDYIFCAFER
jgi:hypothetical protein